MNLRELTTRVDVKVRSRFKPFIMALDRCLPYPLFYSFVMTKAERELFDKQIKYSKFYLEFGSGGSTIRVLQKSKATIHSVESSMDWINEVSRYVLIKYWSNKRLFFHHVNIGKTKIWGYPVGENSKDLFPNYSSNIFSIITSKKVDVVLVDGRFRVACVLSTIIHLFPNDNIVILVHDFWRRTKYHVILKYVTVIDRADSLGVFKIKQEIDLSLVRKDYEIYKFVPD